MNTARAVLWKELNVFNSLTLESSQYAYRLGEEIVRITERDYSKIAIGLMNALEEYGKFVEDLGIKNKQPLRMVIKNDDKKKIQVQMPMFQNFIVRC